MSESNHFHILEQIVDNTSRLVFSYDVQARAFTYLNRAFEQVWPYSREHICTHASLLLDTVHPEDKAFLIKEFEELLNGLPKEDLECRVILPEGKVKVLLLSPILIRNGTGEVLISGIAEDITSKKDNINNLHRFAAKKNSVLEILSHDLAGPLASIQSISGSLVESFEQGSSSEDNKHLLNLIYQTSARSIQLIREFVKQEFLESSNADMVKVRLNLVQKLKEVVEQYQQSEDHIQKHFTFASSSDRIYVSIDQNKFMQVINNLISNSIKFSPDGAHIDLRLTEQEDSILITLQDDGIGIPEKYHDQLFDKFTKARRQGLKGEPSVGLGMSLAKTIVEWHQGRIWFKSQEKQGTTFYIELPKE